MAVVPQCTVDISSLSSSAKTLNCGAARPVFSVAGSFLAVRMSDVLHSLEGLLISADFLALSLQWQLHF